MAETEVQQAAETEEVSIGVVSTKEFKEARAKGEMTVTRAVEGEKEVDVDAPDVESHDADKPRTRKEQRRWDNLVKQREEARAEAKAEKTAKEELRQREADAIKRAEEAEARANTKSEPEDKSDPRPKLEDFNTIEEGQEAIAKWVVKKSDAEKKKAEFEAAGKAEADERVRKYRLRADEYAKTHPKFEERTTAVITALAPIDKNGVTGLADSIMDEENAMQIVDYLHEHLDVCTKMVERGPRWAIAEVGRISERLAIQSAKEKEEADDKEAEEVKDEEEVKEIEEKPKSKAAPPIKPVGGSNTKSSVPLGEADMKSYKARRAAGQIR